MIIIFDFFNVLTFGGSTLATLKRFERHLKDSPVEARRKYLESNSFKLAMKGKISHAEHNRRTARLLGIPLPVHRELLKYFLDNVKLNYTVLRIARKLRRRHKLVMLTDQIGAQFNFWRKKYKLQDHFDRIFCSARLGSLKEEARTFHKVLKELKARPEDCIFIDDMEKNTKVAKALGINTVLFKDARQLEIELRKLLT